MVLMMMSCSLLSFYKAENYFYIYILKKIPKLMVQFCCVRLYIFKHRNLFLPFGLKIEKVGPIF